MKQSLETIEEKLAKKAQKRAKKRKETMKVSGRSVFQLQSIIRKKAKKS